MQECNNFEVGHSVKGLGHIAVVGRNGLAEAKDIGRDPSSLLGKWFSQVRVWLTITRYRVAELNRKGVGLAVLVLKVWPNVFGLVNATHSIHSLACMLLNVSAE